MDQMAGMGSRNRGKRHSYDEECYCGFKTKLINEMVGFKDDVMTFQNGKKMDTNIKKSKIKYLILAAVALLVIPSCSEDILDEQPLDFLSPDNAYQTEAGALQGITAIHDRVRAAYYSFGEFGVMNWATHGSDLGYNGETPSAGGVYLN